MNMKTLLIVGALITGSSALFQHAVCAQAPAAAQQPASATDELFNDALKVAKTNHVENTRKAVDATLARTDLTPEQRAQLLMEMGRVYNQVNQRPNAAKSYAEARAVPGISTAMKYDTALNEAEVLWRIQFTPGFHSRLEYHYFDTYIDQAIQVWKEVLALPDLTNAQRINLYRLIADGYLEKKDTATAERTLEQALKLPNLTPEEGDLAKLNYANVLRRQGKEEQAKKLYQELFLSNKLVSQQRNQVIHSLLEFEKGEDAKNALRQKLGVNVVRSSREVLADATAEANSRWNAYRSLIAELVRNGELKEAKSLSETYADGFFSANKGWTFATAFDQRLSLSQDPQFQLWVGEMSVKQNETSLFGWQQIQAAGHELKRVDLEKQALRKILEINTRLNAVQRVDHEIELVILDSGDQPDRVLKGVAAVLERAEGLKAKEQMDALLTGAKFALRKNYEATARRLHEQHGKLIVNEPKRSLPITFIANGPKDISEFLNSAYFKDLKNRGALDRKYSGDVKLLMETDTANVGRVMTQADGQAVRLDTTTGYGTDIQRQAESATSGEYTFFTASCDEDAVYLFFFVPVDAARAQKIREGTAAIGGFEVTLAEGYQMPYSCLIIDGPNNPEIMDGFITQYNNPHYRIKQLQQKNTKVDFRTLDNGVAMLISFTWDAFIKLPKDGDKWYLEPIHWEKNGWTWGGSNSVHWRETQGELVFQNMTPENRTAIKRRLLQQARSVWSRELSARDNGYVDFMMDNQLGDQQFYQEVVMPLVEKYGAYANRIGGNMTDQNVNEIYDAAYDFLINTRYHLEALRNQYLLKKHTENP